MAAIAAKHSAADFTPQAPEILFNPWTLADITRVSLTNSNEHRAASDVTEQDLYECARLYYEFGGSDMEKGGMEAVTKFLWRVTTAEQLPYQNLGFNHIGRPAALLMQTRPHKLLQVINPGWDIKLFGCSLAEYVGVGQMLYISSTLSEGIYDGAWLAQPGCGAITSRIDPQVIFKTIARHYCVRASEFKALSDATENPDELRRYTHNPLVSKPVIHGLGPHLMVPVPQAILRKLGVLGIYYMGINKKIGFGTAFADDLGLIFEQYVGKQLHLIPEAEVIPEISYGTTKKPHYSIDWFVILPSAVLLVEVKSIRPTEAVRLASNKATEDLIRMLRKSFTQIQDTEEQLRKATHHFSAIPTDRPRIGLVVTLDDFGIANDEFASQAYRPEKKMDVPAAVISVADLENLVTLMDTDIGQLLLDHLTNPATSGNVISSAYTGIPRRRNTIIDEGWRSYPWLRGSESNTG